MVIIEFSFLVRLEEIERKLAFAKERIFGFAGHET